MWSILQGLEQREAVRPAARGQASRVLAQIKVSSSGTWQKGPRKSRIIQKDACPGGGKEGIMRPLEVHPSVREHKGCEP